MLADPLVFDRVIGNAYVDLMKSVPRKKLKKVAASKLSQARGSKIRVQGITRTEARRLAAQHAVEAKFRGSTVKDGAKVALSVYTLWLPHPLTGKDVWVVYPEAENRMVLGPSDIVVICKRTGRVVYTGSANDEG